jgi:serine/threonine protein phosphatase 1
MPGAQSRYPGCVSEVYAIGDVHGCFEELQLLLRLIDVQPEDTLIMLGDLVDRGPNVEAVLEWFHARENTYNVMGNHDHYFIDYAFNGPSDANEFMIDQGLSDTLCQLHGKRWRPGLAANDKVRRFAGALQAKSVPYMMSSDRKYVFCHSTYPWRAGEVFGEDMFWDRWFYEQFDEYARAYRGPVIVHGHTPVLEDGEKIYEDIDGRLVGINLDGGCAYRQPRSGMRGMRVSDGKLFWIPAREIFANPCRTSDLAVKPV